MFMINYQICVVSFGKYICLKHCKYFALKYSTLDILIFVLFCSDIIFNLPWPLNLSNIFGCKEHFCRYIQLLEYTIPTSALLDSLVEPKIQIISNHEATEMECTTCIFSLGQQLSHFDFCCHSRSLGTKSRTKIVKSREFIDFSDQKERYHTPLQSKIGDLNNRRIFLGLSVWILQYFQPLHPNHQNHLQAPDDQATAGLDGAVILYDFKTEFDLVVRCYIQVGLLCFIQMGRLCYPDSNFRYIFLLFSFGFIAL